MTMSSTTRAAVVQAASVAFDPD
ncbi:MAG: hypothetical protein QOF73_3915, partial [Thermomicrobiales bacterium]|nr:hypothetical protein [Thermomicrobiales bacterium]